MIIGMIVEINPASIKLAYIGDLDRVNEKKTPKT